MQIVNNMPAEYRIKIHKGAEVIKQSSGLRTSTIRPIFTWAAKDKDSGCMLFEYTGQLWYVEEDFILMPEGRQK